MRERETQYSERECVCNACERELSLKFRTQFLVFHLLRTYCGISKFSKRPIASLLSAVIAIFFLNTGSITAFSKHRNRSKFST